MKIEDLKFSVRTYNCLKRARIDTVEQLMEIPDDDLLKLRCFGIKCLKEVHDKLGRPFTPGPAENDHNVAEMAFHNGEAHMKEKIISHFRSVAGSMPCITLTQAIKMVEEL